MFETLSKQQLDAMTSDQYKQNFEGPDGDSFRKRVSELENAPRTATRARGNVRGEDSSAVTPTPGFDPSFDDSPNQPAAAVPAQPAAATSAQPAVASAAVDESLPELVHEYQPMDRNGRPVGHKQSFKYRTQVELIEKLTKAHSDASAHIRELSRNRRLEEIVSSGPTKKNFAPSTEVPKTMEELAKELLEQRQQNFLLSVREALNAFQLSADWTKYRSKANAESVVLAVERLELSPADPASYHTAFQHMKDVLEPVVVEPVTPVAAPAATPVVAATPAPAVSRTAQPVGVSTGLSDANAFNGPDPFEVVPKVAGVRLTMPDGKKQIMTLGEWNRQSSEFQKRVLRSSENAAQIESLFEAEDQRKAAARSGAR